MTDVASDEFRTIQFFVNRTTFFIDEVKYQRSTKRLLCTCAVFETAGRCLHTRSVVDNIRSGQIMLTTRTGAPAPTEEESTDAGLFRTYVLHNIVVGVV